MPRSPTAPVLRKELLAFVLAGLIALAVIAFSGSGGDGDGAEPAPPPASKTPAAGPAVDP